MRDCLWAACLLVLCWLIALSTGCQKQRRVAEMANEGHALFERGEYRLAIAKFDEAIRAPAIDGFDRANVVLAYRGRAWSHVQMKQYDAALKDLDEAIRIAAAVEKESPDLCSVADLEAERETVLKARTVLANDVRPFSSPAEPSVIPAQIGGEPIPAPVRRLMERSAEEAKQNNLDAAIATLTEAINTVSESGGALKGNLYAARAEGNFRRKDYDLALADCEKAIQCGWTAEAVFWMRGDILMERGDYEQAIADFSRAIDLNPTSAANYYFRGAAYAKVGNHSDAERDFAKAKELDPNIGKASRLRLE